MTAFSLVIRSVSVLGLAALAAAQPTLVTIRDTVYRADGSPFNGIAVIEWRSFQNPGSVNIGTQSTTARIVSGALQVKLAPTTNATNGAFYLVRYNSDGEHQFSEVWAVPPSSGILKLRDVRATLLPGGVVVGGGQGGIVIGNTSGAGGAEFVDAEVPTGTVDGTNAVFTLSRAPAPAASLALYRNGLLMTNGVDYSLNGVTITFFAASRPQPGDLLDAFFRSGGSSVAVGAHSLLGTGHADTTPSAPSRGGLIVGQGSSPSWTLLPLGAANRCLTSNGTDAVWNTCLYTGFAAGTVPFVDSTGNLTANSAALVWQNTNRRFSVGNSIARSTLNVYDDRAAAVTELIVRGGSGQGSVPVQSWLANNGTSVAWVNADGGFNVRRILTGSTSTRAALSDTGTAQDPGPSTLVNGDLWYNSAGGTWKGRAGGATYGQLQVLCSGTGVSTVVGNQLASCTIPAALLQNGDAITVQAHFVRTAGSGTFTVEARWGTTSLGTSTTAPGENAAYAEARIGISSGLYAWVGGVTKPGARDTWLNSATFSTPAPVTLSFLVTPGVGTNVLLQSFTILRHPVQTTP